MTDDLDESDGHRSTEEDRGNPQMLRAAAALRGWFAQVNPDGIPSIEDAEWAARLGKSHQDLSWAADDGPRWAALSEDEQLAVTVRAYRWLRAVLRLR
jgi:hypothetical protein